MNTLDLATSSVSRRQVIKGGVFAGAVILGGALLLEGCAPLPGSTGGTPGTPKTGGMLIHGIQGGSSTDSLDPHVILSAADWARYNSLYETLWRPSRTYTIDEWLIDSFEANATLDEWTVRLKKGIEFHNGKTVSADDVLFSVQRLLDPATGAFNAGLLSNVDLANSKKIDELTVLFKLSTPSVTFPESMSFAAPIIPTDFDITKPVGTGPFKLQSFTPGQQSVMVRHENYWRDNRPYADGITHINFNDETARINALQGGQINIADFVSYPLIRALSKDSNLKINRSETNSFLPLNMRVDQKPYSDVRVRQALKLLIDRQAMVDGAYLGEGRVANDLYSPVDPLFNSSLPQREQDLDQAKSLLKAAGYEDLQIELTSSNIGAGVVNSTELYAEQAKAAGVDVKVNKVDSGSFYSNFGNWSFSPNLVPAFNYLVTAQQADGPTSVANLSHFDDPEFSSLYYQAVAEPDDTKRKQIADRMQEIQFEKSGTIIWGYQNAVDFTRGIGGMVPDTSGFTPYRSAELWVE